jgi:hypothetical protein
MSELPTIDPLKVAQREASKLATQLRESLNRETQLEILAEALRDQRDEAVRALDEAHAKLEALESEAPAVADITTLPPNK